MGALSDESEALRQKLQLTEARRIAAEESLLNAAEHEAELVESEHARKLIAVSAKWGERLETSLEQLRLKNDETAKRAHEDHELAMSEVTAGYMDEIRKRQAREIEISKLKKKEATSASTQGADTNSSAKKDKSWEDE